MAVQCIYICIYKHARLGWSGGMLPQDLFEIRCSEIASEAILGQKQSHSSYMAHISIASNCVRKWLSQLTPNFHERKYYGWQNSR